MIRLLALAVLFPALQDPPAPPEGLRERLYAAGKSPEAWAARKAEIRQRLLVAAGLWPEFERPPLKPDVFHKVEREDYTVEKVALETWPGFYLSGNLYRPKGKAGPFPGVVSPHGHWGKGRYNDDKDGSLPGRCISMARLGFVVFMYDMVGYGDFKQLPHQFKSPVDINLLGLQLWNSLRAVDFIAALPDVDPKRIAATGASGGGTQTFLLAAVDDRIACAAPVNMVAAEFQGGCSCENAPSLRIDLNNVEIAAATAPRPLLLVCCTGDWTKNTPTLEGPLVQGVYKALGAEEKFRWVQFNYGHNYNQDSREAVYAWFARWMLGQPDREEIPEPPFKMEEKKDLEVWNADHPLPAAAVNAEKLSAQLGELVRNQLKDLWPRDAASLRKFRDVMRTGFWHALALQTPEKADVETEAGTRRATLVVAGDEASAHAMKKALKDRGEAVVLAFAIKVHDHETPAGGNKDQLRGYATCFYRTEIARQVQDILTSLSYLNDRKDVTEVRLVGLGDAGLQALLAQAVAPGDKVKLVVADVGGLNDADPAAWVGVRAQPFMLRLGGLRTAAALAAPAKLVLHDTQGKFDASSVKEAYKAAGADAAVTVSEASLDAEKILELLK